QLAVGTSTLSLLTRAATALESYPSHPIRLIVGFTPGTAADITARAFGNGASELLGQQIVVEINPAQAQASLPNMSPVPPRMATHCSCHRCRSSPVRSLIQIRRLTWRKTSHRSLFSPAELSSWSSVLNQIWAVSLTLSQRRSPNRVRFSARMRGLAVCRTW